MSIRILSGSPWTLVAGLMTLVAGSAQAQDQMQMDVTDCQRIARARLNCIAHLLSQFPQDPVPRPRVRMAERSKKGAYDDAASMELHRWIPDEY